jgi:hypothetical protein
MSSAASSLGSRAKRKRPSLERTRTSWGSTEGARPGISAAASSRRLAAHHGGRSEGGVVGRHGCGRERSECSSARLRVVCVRAQRRQVEDDALPAREYSVKLGGRPCARDACSARGQRARATPLPPCRARRRRAVALRLRAAAAPARPPACESLPTTTHPPHRLQHGAHRMPASRSPCSACSSILPQWPFGAGDALPCPGAAADLPASKAAPHSVSLLHSSALPAAPPLVEGSSGAAAVWLDVASWCSSAGQRPTSMLLARSRHVGRRKARFG